MPASHVVQCDRCSFNAELSELWHGVVGLYRIADLLPIPVMSRWIWCERCDGIAQAERLLDVADILTELWRTRWTFSIWGQGIWSCTRAISDPQTVGRKFHRRILKAMLAWRRSRESPARCLTCGSTTFQLLEDGIGESRAWMLRHPGCGGAIHCTGGSIWTGICLGYFAYDWEGNRDGVYRFSSDGLHHYASDEIYQRLTGDALV